jgi:hypothetical protein
MCCAASNIARHFGEIHQQHEGKTMKREDGGQAFPVATRYGKIAERQAGAA